MSLFFRVSGIVAVLLGFTGAGFVAGEHRSKISEVHMTGPIAPEGSTRINSAGDHVVVHNGAWVLDAKQ